MKIITATVSWKNFVFEIDSQDTLYFYKVRVAEYLSVSDQKTVKPEETRFIFAGKASFYDTNTFEEIKT